MYMKLVYIKERKLSELVKIHYSQKELTTKGISPQNIKKLKIIIAPINIITAIIGKL